MRIYAGLILICLLVGLFAYILINTINDERAQTYREDIATGAFYVVAQGVARQPVGVARENWLFDASNLFNTPFKVIPISDGNFTTNELERLLANKSVVRYSDEPMYADVFQKIANEDNVLAVRLDEITEQQVKAMAVVLLDDLSYYPNNRIARLKQLQPYFSYNIKITEISQLELDIDQVARIRREEVVVLFRDSTSTDNSSIRVVIPTSEHNSVVVMGPIPLFNWLPFQLLASVTLLSLFLISLGVYALIFPLERKLRLIQAGVTRVREGKLDTKVKVVGQDEVAHLAATFNTMTQHIKRLIESQRELTRAVSHELRTPVARIRFAVDMLADTDEHDERLKQQTDIDKDIESLNELIDEILTYAKLEEGSPKMDLTSVCLAELVEQVVKETNALGKPIEVIGQLPAHKVCAIADKRYLHRVVQNLAGNALRYANSKIIISAGVEKNKAFVSVEDDGVGIAEKDREKVFIPFARLDDSRTRASGGYGLGLSIVSRIAFWFNGSMRVDESPDLGGARFVMRWPVKPLIKTIVADEVTQESHEKQLIDKGC